MNSRDRKRLATLGLGIIAVLMALAFTAGVASAQTQEPFAMPKCLPSEMGVGGTGKGFMSKKFATGVCRAGYWCQQADGEWRAFTHCTLTAYDTGVISPLLGASSPSGAVNAAIVEGQVAPAGSQIVEYNALHAAMRAELEATRPPDKIWVVDAATAADGTRPAFPFAAGVRSSASNGRAKAGERCAPFLAQSPSGVSGKLYAAFGPTFSRTSVTLCK